VFNFGRPNIQNLKNKGDINGLNKVLNNKDLNVVLQASLALAELNQYTPALMIGIVNKDWKIRQQTYMAYAKFKNLNFIPLISALHDEHELVRTVGLLGLVMNGEKRGLNSIINCLNDPSKAVRLAAVSSLKILGGKDIVSYLIEAKNDPDDDVKREITNALDELNN